MPAGLARVYNGLMRHGSSGRHDATAPEGHFALKPALKTSPLRLHTEALQAIHSICDYRVYRSGARLFREGSQADAVHILRTGRVALVATSPRGEHATLRTAEAGEALGICSVFSGLPYPFSAEVLTESRVAAIELTPFLDFCSQHPETVSWFAVQLSHELIEAFRHITILLEPRADRRLLQLVLMWTAAHGKRHPHGLAMNASQRQFAEGSGVSRETANRVFAPLKKLGLIRIEQRKLILSSIARLEDYIQSSDAA